MYEEIKCFTKFEVITILALFQKPKKKGWLEGRPKEPQNTLMVLESWTKRSIHH